MPDGSPRFITVGLRACRATTSARTQPVDLALLGDELDARQRVDVAVREQRRAAAAGALEDQAAVVDLRREPRARACRVRFL